MKIFMDTGATEDTHTHKKVTSVRTRRDAPPESSDASAPLWLPPRGHVVQCHLVAISV